MLSSIQVFAAGVTGEESIDLEINGQVVHTYDALGQGAYQGDYVTLNYETDDTVRANDIRILFTNDFYDPAAGIDRNVRIDGISIDGQRYETESAAIFSNGTYLPEDGLQPGYRESEYLHTNGYFQYASAAAVNEFLEAGSLVQLYNAATNTWLALDAGRVVTTATNSTRTYWRPENLGPPVENVRYLVSQFTNDPIGNQERYLYSRNGVIAAKETGGRPIGTQDSSWEFEDAGNGEYYLIADGAYLGSAGAEMPALAETGTPDANDRWVITTLDALPYISIDVDGNSAVVRSTVPTSIYFRPENPRTIQFGPVSYALPSDLAELTILDPNRTDRISVEGTSGDDTARVYEDLIRVDTPQIDIEIQGGRLALTSGVPRFLQPTSGNDRVFIYDSPGNETVEIDSNSAFVRSDSGRYQIAGPFDKYYVFGGEGHDVATIEGTDGNDTYRNASNYARITNSEYFANVSNYDHTVAIAGEGNDRAIFYGTEASEAFVASPTLAEFTGPNRTSLAYGFEKVSAYGRGGNDTAELVGSDGDDTLYGYAYDSRVSLIGTDYYILAKGFREFDINSSGGTDTAFLSNSRGDDRFYGYQDKALLVGDNYRIDLANFSRVQVSAIGFGGYDRAYFLDSMSDDQLVARQTKATIRSAGREHTVIGFEAVIAIGNNGGINTLDEDLVEFNLIVRGQWDLL